MTAAQVPEVSSYTPQAAPVYSKAPQSTFEPPYTRPEAPVYTQPSKPTFAPTYLEQNPPGYSPEQAYIPQAAPAQSVESTQTYTQPEPPIRTFVPSVQQAPPYATSKHRPMHKRPRLHIRKFRSQLTLNRQRLHMCNRSNPLIRRSR